MSVNDKQVAGNHYTNKTYQHWDFVCDTRLHYLLACATKYISRWRDKNGIQDLQKSLHYLEKAEERDVYTGGISDHNLMYRTEEFCNQLPAQEALIIRLIVANEYVKATNAIYNLIKEA